MNTRSNQLHACGGFSLVEVTLALLVVGVGMLAVLGLFPSALDANKKAVDETRMTLFAEEVLEGFRAWSTVKPWDGWDNTGDVALWAPAPDMWENPDALEIRPNTEGVNVYEYFSPHVSDLYEYACNYRVDIGDVAGTGSKVKYIRLEVWNGEFKGPGSESTVFYTELYHSGK